MALLTPDEQLRIALTAMDAKARREQEAIDARRRMILTAHRKGLRSDHIAQLLGLDPKTVSTYLGRFKRIEREAAQKDAGG